MRPAAAAFAFLALLPGAGFSQESPAPAARRIVVIVRDSATKAPLANVGLFQDKSDLPAITDSAGIAQLRVPDAAQTRIVARRVGLVPKELVVTTARAGDSLTVLMLPVSGAQTLPTVEVSTPASASLARYADFERRRTSGRTGIFIVEDELRKRDASALTDLFRRYPSIKVIDSLGVKFVASARTQKPVMSAGRGAKAFDLPPCILRVMMDGVSLAEGIDISVFQVRELHAIEVYPGAATTPVEFAGMIRDSQCGVVMLWTRNR